MSSPRPDRIQPIEQVLPHFREGGMVILVDDEDRENEGDLVVAAEKATAADINFMAREGRGLICLALERRRVEALHLEPMAAVNNAPLGTAFTRSVDLRGAGGIGATGRAATIRAMVDPKVGPESFVTPGHVFPLAARDGGVLVRSGQTEGSVDLARLAGLAPAGVICEVMSPDGSMTRLDRLLEFGARHEIPVCSVEDLIRYRLQTERLMKAVSDAVMPTAYGDFRIRAFENQISGQVHLALTVGEPFGDAPTIVRVHRGDTVADVFGAKPGLAARLIERSMRMMAKGGRGVLLYLRPDGEDEPLADVVRRYGALHRGEKIPPVPRSDQFRDFGIGAQILRELGLSKIRALTSSKPRQLKGLGGFGLEIVDWVQLED